MLVLFEASERSAKAQMGLALRPRLDSLEHRTGSELAASILRRRGYAELIVALQTQDSLQPAGHAIATFNPGGDGPVTVFDSNLGEFMVAPADLQEFLGAWAAAYGESPPPVGAKPLAVLNIAVCPVFVSGDIAATPLASLGEDIRAAGQPADLGGRSPEGSPSSTGA